MSLDPPPSVASTGPPDTHLRELPAVVRRLWSWSNVATFAVLGLIVSIGAGALGIATDAGQGTALAVGGVIVLTAAFGVLGFWWGGRRYDTWRWRLDGDLIEAHWGVLWRHTRLVPRHRVQTVSTDSGPIDRRLGLRTLTVHTAGQATPNLSIPHLTEADVAWIRSELTGERA